MKEKRLKHEEKKARQQMKIEKLKQKKSPKLKQFTCSPCDLTFPNKVMINTFTSLLVYCILLGKIL